MRPRKLSIEGFTCFRAPVEIDFTGFDVFVISGATGAGKSTIIDAICYALYGQVPRDTRIGDLISHDALAMKIQLVFDAGGGRYRVHRGRNVRRTTDKKTGREKVTPDISPVQFEEHRDGDWQPVADRVDEIDAAIVKAVGLDFEGFTRCVLLPQGQFAEFLAGKAEQRRKILRDLLDLHIYERVKVAANARADRLNTQVADGERRIREDYADATEEALAAVREHIAVARPKLDSTRNQLAALQQATNHATTAAAAYKSEIDLGAQLEKSGDELQRAEKDAAGATKNLADLQKSAAAAEAALKASPYDSALHAALGKASALAAQLDRARVAATKASAASSDGAALKQVEARAAAEASALDAARKAFAEAQSVLEEAQRHDAAAHLRTGLKTGDPCPVCGGKVGKLPKGEKPIFEAARKQLDAAKKAETNAAESSQRSQTASAVARREFESAQLAAKDAAAAVAHAESDLKAAIPKTMKPDAALISAELAAQDKAQRAHESLAQQARTAAAALQSHREAMGESDRRIAALKAHVALLKTQIEEALSQRKAEAACVKEIAAIWRWPEIDELIEANRSPAPALKAMLDAAQLETEALTGTIARLESDEERIARAIERAAVLRDELASVKVSWQLARDLGTLLRAGNFPDFVMGEAMDVLASAASEHLKTLHDRYAIAVDGAEFVVVDSWHGGQRRPAKTLSGGETFVASLALALALSERLPELRSAAAASLESLFLDEGFGSLDSQTLDTVITALEGLRSEERMVGIITHVPELAQRVEHRIVVHASPEGSTLETNTA